MLAEIRNALSILLKPGDVYELRIFDQRDRKYCGWFNDIDKMAEAALSHDDTAEGTYYSCNACNPDMLALANNRIDRCKTASSEQDIIRRRIFGIDIDPHRRPAKISSTDTEKLLAYNRAIEVQAFLISVGFPLPIFGDSGNGYHLDYTVDLLNTNEIKKLYIQAYKAIQHRFPNGAVEVQGFADANRIWKVYGTMARKGENMPDRPHRRSKLLEVPEKIELVSLELLQKLAAMCPQPEQNSGQNNQTSSTGKSWDADKLKSYLLDHGVVIERTKTTDKTYYILKTCPFDSTHEGHREAEVHIDSKGVIGFKCWHNSCIDRTWKEVRAIIDHEYTHGGYKSFGQQDTHSESIPEYNTIDDIPLPQEDIIAPISFEGLPDYNFVKMFVDYIATVSDTYPEYSFQNGIAMLSTLVRRKLFFRLNGREEFTNLITLSLGQSGYARKGSSMWAAQKMLKSAVGDTFLSQDVNPEGLIKEMADVIETTQTTRKGCETVPEYQEKHAIRTALRSIWKDEAGQFYAQLNKSHMQSMKELLCHFYDCPTEYGKTLSSKTFKIYAIYFGMNLATTLTSFIKNVTTQDVHTGFLARHNIVNPSYQKTRKDITEDSDKDIKREDDFVKLLKLVDSMLPETALRVKVGDACLKILNKWAKEREEYFAKERNELMGSFFARFQINVLKIALLIELANIPFYLGEYYKNNVDNSQHEQTIIIKPHEIISKNPKPPIQTTNYAIYILLLYNNTISNYKISSISLSINSLLFAIKMYDSIYIPYTHQICVSGGVEGFANYLTTIYKILQDKKKVDYSTLLRNSHAPSMEFTQAISTLIESGAVKEYRVKGKTKPQRVFVYIPPAIEKFNFTPANVIETIDDSVIELTSRETTVVPEASDGTSSTEDGKTHKLGEKSPAGHAGTDGNNHSPNDSDGGRAKITFDFPDEAQKFKSQASPADRVTQTRLITPLKDLVEIRPQQDGLSDESASTAMTPQVFLSCRGWEQSHQQNINSGNLAETTFNLKPQFPYITADNLAILIRRYAKIPEPTGNNCNHPEQCGIINERYLGSIQIHGKEVPVMEEL